jgi:DNA-nicking Smr family endonuclease
MKKLKFNKYVRQIESELDLHGMTEREAEKELYLYLREVVAERQKLVRVITGKGLHSPDGRAVIREMTIDVLKRLNLHFRSGKPDEGGDGAIIVDFTKPRLT